MTDPPFLRGMSSTLTMIDDFQDFHGTNSSDGTSTPPPKEKQKMMGNTMMVPYQRYLDLKATGRVKGGDPNLTGSEPIVYTDENGVEWNLSVHMPSTAGPNMNLGPRRPPITNRHARRAAKAIARRAAK